MLTLERSYVPTASQHTVHHYYTPSVRLTIESVTYRLVSFYHSGFASVLPSVEHLTTVHTSNRKGFQDSNQFIPLLKAGRLARANAHRTSLSFSSIVHIYYKS